MNHCLINWTKSSTQGSRCWNVWNVPCTLESPLENWKNCCINGLLKRSFKKFWYDVTDNLIWIGQRSTHLSLRLLKCHYKSDKVTHFLLCGNLLLVCRDLCKLNSLINLIFFTFFCSLFCLTCSLYHCSTLSCSSLCNLHLLKYAFALSHFVCSWCWLLSNWPGWVCSRDVFQGYFFKLVIMNKCCQ